MERNYPTNIEEANREDIPALVTLLNSAYRGERSQRGWTTEAHLIAGEVRTDENNLVEVMEKESSIFLKYTNKGGNIIGCVNLQKHARGVYLGMFSVDPDQQGGGIGKKLLDAAEIYSKAVGSSAIYMFVISARDELISWYLKRGYYDTGERVPFKEDGLTGKHLRELEFMILEKKLA